MKIIKVKGSNEIPKNFTGVTEFLDGTKYWIKEGLFHREDGPAIEHANGIKEWFKEGKLHREDEPAVEFPDGSKHWYKDDKLHRLDGPAIENSDGTIYCYLENEYYPPISLNDFIVLGYDKGEYGLVWYRLLDKDEIFECPDIPGLITK